MDALSVIFNRQSVRKYTDRPVSGEVVETLLKAGMSAPSAGDERPWHFVVIRDRDILQEVPTFHEYAHMLECAPAAILVCGDRTLEKFDGYWSQDCAIAAQNIWLAAAAQGLGCVWLGIHPIRKREDGMRRLLNIPEQVNPFALMSLGWPDSELPERGPRYDSERVHHDGW